VGTATAERTSKTTVIRAGLPATVTTHTPSTSAIAGTVKYRYLGWYIGLNSAE
jgi:hypothetical protein